MSEASKYQMNFSGQFTGSQLVVGEHNTAEQHVTLPAGGRLDPQELEVLTQQLAQLRDQVTAQLAGDDRQQALAMVDDLEAQTLSPQEPEPRRLARVYRWFLNNGPDVAESISSLLLGPLVGKLVGGGTSAMAAALGADTSSRGHEPAAVPVDQ